MGQAVFRMNPWRNKLCRTKDFSITQFWNPVARNERPIRAWGTPVNNQARLPENGLLEGQVTFVGCR